ncbi:MAG: aminotransferase class I/II-fold pyridoxal phosphate-dependent enzyme, partial [Bacillota bacterium]|nr:aminotransferase class I/II-fold pyridoxal phosphate-dependent enzyme [Bacillota bacterium]
DILVKGLRSIPGFSCPTPRGAFYAFPNITETGFNSTELADKLLEEGGVATLDGRSFGAEGNGYLRFSYVNSKENIYKALERIESVVTQTAKRKII